MVRAHPTVCHTEERENRDRSDEGGRVVAGAKCETCEEVRDEREKGREEMRSK